MRHYKKYDHGFVNANLRVGYNMLKYHTNRFLHLGVTLSVGYIPSSIQEVTVNTDDEPVNRISDKRRSMANGEFKGTAASATTENTRVKNLFDTLRSILFQYSNDLSKDKHNEGQNREVRST